MANSDVLESLTATEAQKHDAKNVMKELAPGVIAIGLHKHVIFKNPEIEQILSDAKQSLDKVV